MKLGINMGLGRTLSPLP